MDPDRSSHFRVSHLTGPRPFFRLIGSFDRDIPCDPTRLRPRPSVPILAFQLAHEHPTFSSAFLPLPQSNLNGAYESLYSQMGKLIIESVRSADISTLMVICPPRCVFRYCRRVGPSLTPPELGLGFLTGCPPQNWFLLCAPQPCPYQPCPTPQHHRDGNYDEMMDPVIKTLAQNALRSTSQLPPSLTYGTNSFPGQLTVFDVFLLDSGFKIERLTRYYCWGLHLIRDGGDMVMARSGRAMVKGRR